MQIISVGSQNPAKISSIENAVKKIWPDAKITAVAVPSGVRTQPTSDDEAIAGATNRAKLSLQKTNADFGMGLEACTVDTQYGMFTTGWVVAVDKNGKIGIGGSSRLVLPEIIASKIRKGQELGTVIDAFAGTANIKHKQGAIGILTNNLISRSMAFEQAVIYALAKFITPDYYQ